MIATRQSDTFEKHDIDWPPSSYERCGLLINFITVELLDPAAGDA